jgi:hypothetical protein
VPLLTIVTVSDDKWRDAIKFLMGLGTNHTLTAQDQKKLAGYMRGLFADGMTEPEARRLLAAIGWQRVIAAPRPPKGRASNEPMARTP